MSPGMATAIVVGAIVVLLYTLMPTTFPQRIIAVGIALALAVRVLRFIDAGQQRDFDRLARRLENQVKLAVAETQAREREATMNLLMQSFVVSVHGEAGAAATPSNVAISVGNDRAMQFDGPAPRSEEPLRRIGLPQEARRNG